MDRTFFILGALLAMAAVGAGAFGAHGLRDRVSSDLLVVFETAVRYHMYHALGLIVVALAAARWPDGMTNLAGWLFIAGIVLFSGSLYLMTFTGLRWLGAITPLGGAAFIAGWLALAWTAWKG